MDQLLHLDQSLFHFINHDCKNTFFDWLLPYWRNKYFWLPLYMLLAGSIVYQFRKKGGIWLLTLLLALGISDFVSSSVVKNQVQRIRPCNQVGFKETAHLLVPCGSGYSFTSSHASNHFSIAVALFLTVGVYWKWLRLPLLLWASSIALAQVYVGVHYPADVLAGALLGGGIGLLVVRASDFIRGYSCSTTP